MICLKWMHPPLFAIGKQTMLFYYQHSSQSNLMISITILKLLCISLNLHHFTSLAFVILRIKIYGICLTLSNVVHCFQSKSH